MLAALLVLALAACAHAALHCKGTPNTHPIIASAPQPLRRVANGALFAVEVGGGAPPLLIAHVYGSAYEMGKAQGELLRNEIRVRAGEERDSHRK